MITDFTNPERKKWSEITKRPELDLKKLKPLVKKIFKDVNENGDKSLFKYTKEFDKTAIKSIKAKRKDLFFCFLFFLLFFLPFFLLLFFFFFFFPSCI